MSKGKEFWRSHVLASGPKGTQLQEYARRHGLKIGTLRWWRSKLRDEVVAPKVATSRFVAVRVAPVVTPDHPAPVVTSLGIGERLRLELPSVPSPQWLAAMDKALREVG